MNTQQFLDWLHGRLQYVHNENPRSDFMLRLRGIKSAIAKGERECIVKQITMYETNDGRTFRERFEAEQHEQFLKDKEIRDGLLLITGNEAMVNSILDSFIVLTRRG